MKYKSVLLTKRGGPEVLEVVERELHTPKKEETLIKVAACGVGRTDIAMRVGYYPFAPRIPFVPGYEIVGIIEAVGDKVTKFRTGDVVAALTVYGGYSEYIYLHQEHLVRVPEKVNPGDAVSLILNYITAYQILKRVAMVQRGDRVLITGASGGVGSALLDLGRLEGLHMFGTASIQKHKAVKEQGAIALDYNSESWVVDIKDKETEGLDFVFDGIGNSHIGKGFGLLKKGGKLVEYAYPNFSGMLKGMLKLALLNFAPNGRQAEFYGISKNYKMDKSTILEDLGNLFSLLTENKVKPEISMRIPILEAREANRILESGSVTGKLVLMSPEFL